MSSEHTAQTHDKPLSFHIIINARPREVSGEQISYSQVVNLAFPDDPSASQFLYSVHYIGPHLPDGTLAEGQSVKLENGMKFDVTKTNRS
ncbi:MAG: multiubiquitin domain-containing protein [Methylobacter sp.]